MRLFATIAGLRRYLELHRTGEQHSTNPAASVLPSSSLTPTVGFVPTMGALHTGHLSLIQRARQENAIVVVSIFVNPLQFGPNEDFSRYPRTLEQDQALCEQVGVDVIFAPTPQELYGNLPMSDAVTQVIPPSAMMAGLCGRYRPGHFSGVTTVVSKLFNIVQPDRAYFGQKDAQQLAILKRMVADLNLPIEVVGCPIVREPDGLALSSRNRYLSVEERLQATVLYRGLKQAEQVFQDGKRLREELIEAVKAEFALVPTVKPQYIELVHPDTMVPLEQIEDTGLLAVAAYLGSTRLIDNIVLQQRKPILAIDGPAGAGKSTVARRVAEELGLLYLDTGAMYRAVTWLALTSGIALEDEAAIAEMVSQAEIGLESAGTGIKVWINGQDITQEIRSLEVTAHVSTIAAQASVRQNLVKQQQAYGRKGGIVMDGRDIGTHVFPDAELKIFLTASVSERARRRQQDLYQQGQPTVSLASLEQAIYERDQKDSTRRVSPLRQATDAIEIQTDNLSVDEVVAKIIRLYQE
ncbi:MAG TPA: bifunctional pantoate--beta-alanine ligase/(d)CMP kinase, partial [Allocoleopsis sp.]